MGSYNTAVITTVGQALLTSVLGAQGTMTFTKLQTSSYAYASGTDLSALTSLNNVEQEANIGSATIVDSTHIAADATISNSGISTEYNANTLGIFASDGVNEVLFAVSTAVTPDVIPADQGGTPSTYKYNFTLAVSSTSDITISAVGNIDASDVAYDNSVSGLSASNVQAAIDEIVSSVKRTGKITLSAVSVELTNETPTATVSFTTNSDGVASVASSDPTIATASLSGTVVTITGLRSGTPTVTISIPETEHYTACSATISVESNIIAIGETYFFGGFYWTAAEDLGDNAVCLQSQGMTAGTWPGYKLTSDYSGTKSYGNANTGYNGNIDGDNIANYDDVTSTWYAKYSSVEKTGQAYGSGLFLVSNAKCNQTTSGQQGSGNYWSGLKEAATNGTVLGAASQSAYLGTNNGSSLVWFVFRNGNLSNDASQNGNSVIAPAFNLDLTKVKLVDGDHIMLPTEEMPTLVTWANGTEAQIKAELDAYYDGIISWTDMGWNVGDTRTIHLDAMTAPNPYTGTWDAQDIVAVIVDHNHNDLATPINGHTKGCITVHTRECMNNCDTYYNENTDVLNGHIYVNGNKDTETVFTKWSALYMRTYLNSTVLGAIPSGDFKSAIRPSKHYRHTTSDTSASEQVIDTLFLPSHPEMFGTEEDQYYIATSPVEGTQLAYYVATANRIKYGNNNGSSNGVAQYYWTGSAMNYSSGFGYGWDNVLSNGNQNLSPGMYSGGHVAYALAPAWTM